MLKVPSHTVRARAQEKEEKKLKWYQTADSNHTVTQGRVRNMLRDGVRCATCGELSFQMKIISTSTTES